MFFKGVVQLPTSDSLSLVGQGIGSSLKAEAPLGRLTSDCSERVRRAQLRRDPGAQNKQWWIEIVYCHWMLINGLWPLDVET